MKMFNSPYKVINKRKYNTWCKYKTRIDTYGCGCQHDCGYCYARAILNFRNNWNSDNPKSAYITDIEDSIRMLPKNEVVRIGSMTDCFQPIELREKITYQTIKLLNKYRINYLIVTKNSLVSENRYIDLYDKNLAHFQITITSTDDGRCAKYEKTSVTSDRIKSIEKLSGLGFDVSVRLSPFLYQWVDAGKINRIKCDKILIEFLKVNHWVRKNFSIDYSSYTHKYGGHDNLELEKKIELVKMINGIEKKSVGEYVKEHYEYFRENVNYNKDDCCNLDATFFNEDCEQVEMELNNKPEVYA